MLHSEQERISTINKLKSFCIIHCGVKPRNYCQSNWNTHWKTEKHIERYRLELQKLSRESGSIVNVSEVHNYLRVESNLAGVKISKSYQDNNQIGNFIQPLSIQQEPAVNRLQEFTLIIPDDANTVITNDVFLDHEEMNGIQINNNYLKVVFKVVVMFLT